MSKVVALVVELDDDGEVVGSFSKYVEGPSDVVGDVRDAIQADLDDEDASDVTMAEKLELEDALSCLTPAPVE